MLLHRRTKRRIKRWRQNGGDDAEHRSIRRAGLMTRQERIVAEDFGQRLDIADCQLRDLRSRKAADPVAMKPPLVHSTHHQFDDSAGRRRNSAEHMPSKTLAEIGIVHPAHIQHREIEMICQPMTPLASVVHVV